MLKSCPDSVDVTDLQFKLQCRLKIFENNDVSKFSSANSILSCASRYGLLFAGTNSNHFQVIQTQILHSYTPKDKDVIDYPRRNVVLPSSPKHLCVNCDNTIIAVVVEKDQCSVVIFYDVLSLLTQNIRIIKEIRLSSTPNVYVREINWNPSLPGVFTACKSDGTLGVYELKGDSVDINELPAASGATCFCWSPKGKQIAVGSKDGKITQYKPDLKAVKVINEPQLGNPHTLISLQWVSNYQFIGVYQSVQTKGSSSVVVVDAPKTGEPSYTNYDDICYSGSSRPSQFYLILQQNWNFLMVASANSSEVGVLGSSGDSWTQWMMSDTARAELPLSPDHQETLPVGLTFDTSSTTPLPWGESSIPPCPLLFVLSNQGVLCCFNVVYLRDGIPSVCRPPDEVQDTSGLSSFVTTSENKTSAPDVEHFKSAQPPSVPIQFGMGHTPQAVISPVSKNTLSGPKATLQFTPPTQSTPLVTGKVATDLSSKNLFAGQATLTPIKPQQPSQGVSFFGGKTLITPISKGPNATSSITSISATQSTNINNEKYASIFASLNPTTLQTASTVPVKPIVISAASTAPKPAATVQPPEIPTTKLIEDTTYKPPFKQITTPNQEYQVVDPKLKAETSAMLSQMVRDEWMYLEAELKVLLNQGRTLKISLGSEEEKVDMITHIDSLQEFVKEAVDISVGQSSEIHCLKQNLIQSWAWFEEANSYYNSSKNEAVTLLLKLQPLDSVSQKRLKDIEQLTYYIESQLQQTSKTLDEQWGNFQDYAKKTHRIQMPTMEAIFQTMVSQSAILQKHTYILKDISMRLRKKTFGVSSLLLSLDKADNLVDDFRDLHLDANTILQLQYEKIKNHTKILSNKKATMLRALLKQRDVTHITAVRPQLSSWTINQSPASRMRQSISILGAQMSSVSKSPVAKSLSFIQSTPLKGSDVAKPAQVSQGLTFSLGSPDKPRYSINSNAASVPSGFVSLAKSGPIISNSQGSAFAPIGFTATSSAASENHQIFSKTNLSTMPFTFGSTVTTTTKNILSSTQVKPSFSTPLFNTAPVGVTATSGQPVTLASSSSLTFKYESDTSALKPQLAQPTTTTSSFAFSFGSSSSPSKNIFGVASSTTSVTGSNNLFFSGSPNSNSSFIGTSYSPIADSSNTQVIKPTSVATTMSPSMGIKPVPLPTTPNIFGSQQSSFAPLNKSVSVTTLPTAVSTSTPPKTSSGVASIFANLQSVIDKATGSTAATTTRTETQKPTLSFEISTGPTTTHSLFESVSSTSTTKPVFETTTLSSTGGLFGSISKPVEAFTSIPDTPSIYGSSSSTFFATTPSPSNQETSILLTPSSLESTKPLGIAKDSSLDITSTEITSKSSFSLSSPISTTAATVKIEPLTLPSTTEISMFDSKPTFSPSSTSVSTGATTTSTIPSIFSTSATTTVPKPGANIFGAPITTSTTTVSGTTTSIFGSSKTTGLIAPSVPGSMSQSVSLFGNTTPIVSTSTASNTTDSNIFAASMPTSTPSTNIFASKNSGSIFGSSEARTTSAAEPKTFDSVTSASVFATPGSGKNIFGSPTTTSVFLPANSSDSSFPPTTAVSAFGTSTTSSNIFGSSGSIFGSNSATPASNIFGTPTTTIANVFVTPTSTSTANIFGSAAPASTTQNMFGAASSNAVPPFGTQSGSIFGTPKTTGSVFDQQGVFGSQTTTAPSIFGQPATFGTSDFGSSTTTTSGNIFGSAVSSSSEFGTGFDAVSASNTFGSQATTQSQPAGSFGFGSLNVDSTSSSTGNIFGSSSNSAFGATPSANPFGKVETKSAFGSSSANIFGNSPSGATATNIFASPATTASSVFGSGGGTTFGTTNTGGAFGSPSTFGSSAFGQKPAFGQASTFVSNTFGSPQPGSFSGSGASPIAQSGFGSQATFQKPSGFGSPPVFGGSPTAFGATPSFGGSPAFGSAPTFGSPEKVFGGPQSPSGGFGAAATQQTAGFGNLASQNTIGFGSLAQQATTPTSAPFSSGNSSFSSWR